MKKVNYYSFIRPFLFLFPPETMHHLAIFILRKGYLPSQETGHFPRLSQQLFGKNFFHPLGLAAGFDKNGEGITSLTRQGLSFIEIGTVTPEPQPGNPKPRIFRLTEDQAIINRLGFNNKGASYVLEHLKKCPPHHCIMGINIGKNKTTEDPLEDYLTLLDLFYGHSDYITINISSPNTPGLRQLQEKASLATLLSALTERKRLLAASHPLTIPLFLKIAPDLSPQAQEDIAETLVSYPVDGLIISNTTLDRPATLRSHRAKETGGLSGKPLFSRSTEVLRHMYYLTQGKIPLIGVGGITSAEDAYQKILAGASLIQIYSAFIYQGFTIIPHIIKGLDTLLEKDGFRSIKDAIGAKAG